MLLLLRLDLQSFMRPLNQAMQVLAVIGRRAAAQSGGALRQTVGYLGIVLPLIRLSLLPDVVLTADYSAEAVGTVFKFWV